MSGRDIENFDLIGNTKSNSVIYDLPQQRTRKRGRPTLRRKTVPPE